MSNSNRDGVRVKWSEDRGDLVVQFDRERGQANPRFILELFPEEVTDELEARGYDITTLQFEILKQ